MRYRVELKPKAIKDLRRLPKREATRMANAITRLADNLNGDVKKLTNYSLRYRLRVGSYRILFKIENSDCVTIYRILHRQQAYRQIH
uniref:mRNA interferase RelE/StbE n=1 Tax=Candidatus Kentrum sp. FM TaxID=2126340 RepID=A0A450SQ60_9GAMM|nr:MAG: mRNA interferase RelE/StbE [Candidatus Kentron sp. FM]VFJ56127.1 MAG: mRNA interferase RelE/StbE [Candidatus Kentron sp. FM]VFK10476.1 MAG: mRNA interferase RelE/StbE [Candidatus Kentron sp. FM]